MHTHFLSDAVVAAYLSDLSARLIALGNNLPKTWIALGSSGDKIVEALLDNTPEDMLPNELAIERLVVDRKTGEVKNRESSSTFTSGKPENVLLIDGPVHSGASMQAVSDWLYQNGIRSIISYGLVVKRTSDYIPTFFGLMIEEHDRALFQLHQIPNNRLLKKPPSFGTLRAIRESDAKRERQHISNNVNSIQKISFADLWYGRQTRGDYVYVYEIAGAIAGFVHFYRKKESSILIDVIAVDNNFQKQDIASALMRWVENWARCYNLSEIELHAIENRIGMYERYGYEKVGDSKMDLGDNEVYYHMRKKILYNIDPDRNGR